MLYLKDGSVNPDFTAPMLHAHLATTLCFFRYGYDCILTSGRDATHMATSLHQSGNAGDYRIHHVPLNIMTTIMVDLKTALGPRYDVVLEDAPPHLHVEYDPKAPIGGHA